MNAGWVKQTGAAKANVRVLVVEGPSRSRLTRGAYNPIQPRVGRGRLLRRGSGYSGAQQISRQRSIVVTWVPVGMWVDGGAGSPHSA